MKALPVIVVAAVVTLGGVVRAQEVGGFPMASPSMVTPSNSQAENPTMVTPSNVNPEVENPTMVTPTGEAMNPLGGSTIGSFSIPHESIPSSPIPHEQIHNFSIPAFSIEHNSVPSFASIPSNPIPHSQIHNFSIPAFSLGGSATAASTPAATYMTTDSPAAPAAPAGNGARLSN